MNRPSLFGLLALSLTAVTIPQQSLADEDEAQRVAINLTEWELGFHKVNLKGKKARLEIKNDGTIGHAFELEGKIRGKEFEIATPVLNPGEAVTLIVELPEGEYEVYCPVPGHKERGMAGDVVFGRESGAATY